MKQLIFLVFALLSLTFYSCRTKRTSIQDKAYANYQEMYKYVEQTGHLKSDITEPGISLEEFDPDNAVLVDYLANLDLEAIKKEIDERAKGMDGMKVRNDRYSEFQEKSKGMSEEDRIELLETEYRDLIANYKDKVMVGQNKN